MSKATSDLLSHFEAKEVEGSPPGPSWNVAPTQNVPIVAERLPTPVEVSAVILRAGREDPMSALLQDAKRLLDKG